MPVTYRLRSKDKEERKVVTASMPDSIPIRSTKFVQYTCVFYVALSPIASPTYEASHKCSYDLLSFDTSNLMDKMSLRDLVNNGMWRSQSNGEFFV